tara:strand:- start:961 stop:1632 length:672 start_codon:yes stop_codon:yes gene_type:complete
MHLRKSKKVLIYFLLLLIVGSINNIALNKINLSDISNIEILGLGQENNNYLLENIKNLELENIFLVNKDKLHNVIDSNSLVEKYDIFKVYPSSLYINIKKTKFLARLNHQGVNYIVGSNGKLSENKISDENLPFIFGKPEISEFLKLKKIIDTSNFDFKKIKNFYYFTTGRWDLELNDNIIVKLPEKNVDRSLKLVFEFLDNEISIKKKLIDARVENQIILND